MRKKGSREITHMRENCSDALGWYGNKRYTSEISQGHLLMINGRERRLQVGFSFLFCKCSWRRDPRLKENEKLWSFSSNFTIWKKIRNVDSMTVEKKKESDSRRGEEKRERRGKRQILLG